MHRRSRKLLSLHRKKNQNDPATAIGHLRETQEMYTKNSEMLEKQIAEQTKIAKQNAIHNKKAALAALAKRKRLQTRLEKMDNASTLMENQIAAIEMAGINKELVNAMSIAGKSLEHTNKGITTDSVNSLIDSMQEQMEVNEAINNAISDSSPFGNAFDDDELERELEKLQTDELEDDLTQVSIDLPSIPNEPIPEPKPEAKPVAPKTKAKSSKDDRELEALVEWAS